MSQVSKHANASRDSSSESSNARGHRRALGVLDAGSPSKALDLASDNPASLAAHEPPLGAA